jgi:hypothetical protein
MPTLSNQQQKYFRSIFVPGLYSLQCVSRTSGAPDVTIYRQDLDQLVGGGKGSFLHRMRASKRFEFFILRHSKDRVDFFDGNGRVLPPGHRVPEVMPTSMAKTSVRCDNASLAAQSSWLMPRPTVCGSFEAHAGQSAAERGNFYTMLDQMLNAAKNDNDREHIYVLSHHEPCPRSVLAADLTKVSDRVQGVFLDYYRRFSKGWPICAEHHSTELARTLSSCRYEELRRWLRAVRALTDPSDDLSRFEMVLMSLPLSVKFGLARILVREVYSEFTLAEGDVERLSDEVVIARHKEIGASVDQLLAIPLSNS